MWVYILPMVLQHQRRRELCEQTHRFRPARVGDRLGSFVVLHANIQVTEPQRDPRVGLIRSRPWAGWLWPGCDIARRTETLLLFGFPRRVKATDVTKTARRFLKKKENTEEEKRTQRRKKQKQKYKDQRKSQGIPLSP